MKLFCGCVNSQQAQAVERLKQFYNSAAFYDSEAALAAPIVNSKLIDLSASNMSLASILRYLADTYNLSVVADFSLLEKTVTLELRQASVSSALTALSRQLSTSYIQDQDLHILSVSQNYDKGILCMRSPNIEFQSILPSVMSSAGRFIYQDGVLMVFDTSVVLRRVSALIKSLDLLPVQYSVQFFLVVIRRDLMASAGFSMKPSGKMTYDISQSKVSFEDLALQGLFDLTEKASIGKILCRPMLFCRLNKESTWGDGEQVPVPRKQVSQYGAVTTVGYDITKTGLQFAVTASTSSRQTVCLDIKTSVSDIVRYVDDQVPVLRSLDYNFQAHVIPGKLYLLGDMTRDDDKYSLNDILHLTGENSRSIVQLWGIVYPITVNSKIKD